MPANLQNGDERNQIRSRFPSVSLVDSSSDENAISPYAAPARAQNLADLPPAYICIGEVDLMRDENIEYAMRLMQAGVQTELHIYPGAFHGFDLLAPTAQVSQRAVSEYVAALKRGLYR